MCSRSWAGQSGIAAVSEEALGLWLRPCSPLTVPARKCVHVGTEAWTKGLLKWNNVREWHKKYWKYLLKKNKTGINIVGWLNLALFRRLWESLSRFNIFNCFHEIGKRNNSVCKEWERLTLKYLTKLYIYPCVYPVALPLNVNSSQRHADQMLNSTSS